MRYFKDLNELNKNKRKMDVDFIKEHPVGYGITLLASFTLPIIPFAITKIKEEITKKKK